MGSNRREFIAGTGATLAALSGLTACAKREAAAAAADPLAGIADELLADYPENATGLGIDTGRARGAQGESHATVRRRGQQAIAKRVAERLARLKSVDASTLDDAARIDLDVVRTAHETAAEGFAFPVWRRRAPEFQLVLAQRALRRRAEHRRLPRDPEPARGAAHRRRPVRTPRPISSASRPMPASSTARPGA